jgi:hypothetical protein
MKNVEKLLMVGPSSLLSKWDKEKYNEYRSNGYKIFGYSGGPSYLKKIGVPIDYYCFLDPWTTVASKEIFQDNYFKNTTLLYCDIYRDKYKKFNNLGYTCNRFKRKPKEYSSFSNMSFLKHFKNSIPISVEKNYLVEELDVLEVNWREKLFVTRHKNRQNADKFSCFLMPIVINKFENLKEVMFIGFGDFDTGRIQDNSTSGYHEYKRSFTKLWKFLKRNLEIHQVKYNFAHKNYFSQILENDWK